jgi:hypothetical protein
MTDLLIWTGPVETRNLASVKWQRPTGVYTVGGEGSDYFSGLGRSLAPGIVGKLSDKWRAQTKPAREAPDRIAMASFSAGHGLIETVCKEAASLSQLAAVCACDSYYVAKQGDIKAGYRAACERAVAGEMLVILTTGASGGMLPDKKPFPSSREAFAPLADELGLSEIAWPEQAGNVPAPERLLGRGLCFWLDYDARFKHVEHALKIAPAVIGAMVSPYMAGSQWPPPASAPDDGTGGLLALLALITLGVVI